jgi:hypothetical protein
MNRITTISLVICIISTSCVADYDSGYLDLSPPALTGVYNLGDLVIIQLDEPVQYYRIHYTIDGSTSILQSNNSFPVANFHVPAEWFPSPVQVETTLISEDTAGNTALITFPSPVINHNPATIYLGEIRFGYSKNKTQYIRFDSIKSGLTNGYLLVVSIRGKPVSIPFNDSEVRMGNKSRINIIRGEPLTEQTVTITGQNSSILLPTRLSSRYGVIQVHDHNGTIHDSFCYYNSTHYTLEELQESSRFRNMVNRFFPPSVEIDSDWVDITGSGIKNPVVRQNMEKVKILE